MMGRYRDAEAPILKAIELGSKSPVIHEHLGDVYARLGEFDKALDAWRKALELAPDGTGGRAICDCHGSEFDLRTGAVLRGPADRPIAVFPVAERDGRLEVEVPG